MRRQLDDLLESASRLMDRLGEAEFEELVAFVEQREQFVDQLRANPLSEEERRQLADDVHKLLSFDEAIVDRMLALKDEAASGLVRLKGARTQKTAYDQVYSPDSLFFDKRK